MKNYISRVTFLILIVFAVSCDSNNNTSDQGPQDLSQKSEIEILASSFTSTSDSTLTNDGATVATSGKGWLAFDLNVFQTGRYQVDITAKSGADNSNIWIEDYVDNRDGRNYDITGRLVFSS